MQAAWHSGGFASYAEKMEGSKIRIKPESFNDHYTQATLFWNSMSEPERRHIIKAFYFELGKVTHRHIREKMVDHLNHVNHELAIQVSKGIAVKSPPEIKSKGYIKKSAALSQENHKIPLIKGRKIAILAADGVHADEINETKNRLEKEGLIVDVISKLLGSIETNKEETILVDASFLTNSSVMYDAVFVPHGSKSIDALLHCDDALKFVNEAYRHCKPIGAMGHGIKLLQKALFKNIPYADVESNAMTENLGVLTAGSKTDINSYLHKFREILADHRHWKREDFV
jgi:catalase